MMNLKAIGEKKFCGRAPTSPALVPTLVLEIVESRAIAHLKAKSEKNAQWKAQFGPIFLALERKVAGKRQS